MQAAVGQAAEIAVFLDEGVTGFFPRATVKTLVGVTVPGSPVSMADRGDGWYTGSIVKDRFGVFTVLVEVFTDAGFTSLDENFKPFTMLIEDAAVPDKIGPLIGVILEEDPILGIVVEDINPLFGVLAED